MEPSSRDGNSTSTDQAGAEVGDRQDDAFALLGLAPLAALAADQIEEAFRQRATDCHPDADGGGADGDRFAALGAARERLLSVAGRLDELRRRHAGVGEATAEGRRTVTLSAGLNRLFPVVGSALEGAREAIGRRDRAQSDLARALVTPALLAARAGLIEAQQQVRATLAEMERALPGLDRELAAGNDGDGGRRQRALGELDALQGQFACLERWHHQLRQQTAACMF